MGWELRSAPGPFDFMRRIDPFTIAIDYWTLGFETWMVIGLRMPRLLKGDPAAMAEARLMVTEKMEAASMLPWKMFSDIHGTPHHAMDAAIGHYRKAVGKNRRRLSRRR